jgi:short-subunit dehydrogenase
MCALPEFSEPNANGEFSYEDTSSTAPFLLRRRRNTAKAVLIGGAALAGLAALGSATIGAFAMAAVRRARARSLKGKTVVITGSSRGLGLAMAEEFALHGARVVLTARDGDELQRARALLLEQNETADPDEILVVPGDLRIPEEADYLIHRATEAFGQVDILVNNAGIITVGPIEDQTAESFHEVMETNFFSGVHCTLSVLPQMLARGQGTIVNITSIGGKIAVPHLLPYTASKFAAVGFSEGLHAEIKSKGVHVLTVCPGLMRTGSHLNAKFSGDAEREYRWFSLSASLPGASTSAQHAARRIVRAVLSRETEIAITPQAVVAARLGNLSPALTAGALRVMNRILPEAVVGESRPVRGADARGRETKPAATLGWAAGNRYNETGGINPAR